MKRSALIAGLVVVASCAPQRDDPKTQPPETPPVSTTQQPLGAFRPVIGGHLLVSADQQRVVVADVEGERLRFIDATRGTVQDVDLGKGAWPTRVLEVAPDQFQVILRGTGELATVTLTADGPTVTRVAVCGEPRGLIRDADETVIACAGGELVRAGATVRSTKSNVEWRDLAMTPNGLVGTSFRNAQLVKASDLTRSALANQRVTTDVANPVVHIPQVAWRLSRTAGATFIVHQLHADALRVETTTTSPNLPPSTSSSPYGGGVPTPTIPGTPPGCSASAVVTGVTKIDDSGNSFTAHTNDVLPVDAAISPDGSMIAIASAGGTGLSVYPTRLVQGTDDCMTPTGGVGGLSLTSVAWLSNTRLVILESLRSTPMIFDLSSGLAKPLGTSERGATSPAFTLFHTAPRGGAPLACASCHPEGGEDGHVWVIDGAPRRTQTLAGGVMARAPFHWKGDLTTLTNLMDDTFVKRMGATALNGTDTALLGSWLDTIPAPRASRILNTDERAAGLAAFNKASCSTCHLNGGTQEGPGADIGTGETVRSPNLQGVSARAPYLHTGEIPDLRTRVTGSLHPAHGSLSALNSDEKESLIAFLESL